MSFINFVTDIPDIMNLDISKEKENILNFCKIGEDILSHPRYIEMKGYNHHGTVSCHYHSVFVAYMTYKACCHSDCNTVEATRAALLHDFYLYDWHIVKHDEYHAFYHPKEARKNAEKYFGRLTDLQTDMILAHMWPMHLMPPKSKEGMILTAADKICASCDFIKLSEKFKPIYDRIDEVTLSDAYN